MSEHDEEKTWAAPAEPGTASTPEVAPAEAPSAHLEQSPYPGPVEQAPPTQQVPSAPVPAYGAPSYPAAAPGYGPPQGYQAPPQGYQAPPPGYQAAPPTGYEAPALGQPLAAPQGYPPNIDPNVGYAPVPPVPGYDPNLAYGAPPAAVQPPKKSRKGMWITLIIIAVLVIGGAAGAVVLLRKSSTDGQSAVKNYLNALAAGDAKKVLSDVSTQPPSTTFLTSDILSKQVALAKITNIKVQKPTSNLVHATYTYGSRQVDEEFEVVKSGDSYKLAEGAVKIDVSALTIPSLTLFGKPVSASTGTIYVFPGPLTWGTSNPDFTVTNKDADTWPASPMDASTYDFTLSADLSDVGKQAVMAAVKTYLDACVASKSLAPTGCPQQEDDPDGVDGTAAWTLSSDLGSALKYEVDPSTTSSVDVTAPTLNFSVSYQSKDDESNVTQQTDTAEEYLDGTVDLTTNPPVFKSD